MVRTIERCFVCSGPVTVVKMLDRTKFYQACHSCGHTEAVLAF